MNSSVKHFQTKDSGIDKNAQKYYFNKSTNAIKYKLSKNKNQMKSQIRAQQKL